MILTRLEEISLEIINWSVGWITTSIHLFSFANLRGPKALLKSCNTPQIQFCLKVTFKLGVACCLIHLLIISGLICESLRYRRFWIEVVFGFQILDPFFSGEKSRKRFWCLGHLAGITRCNLFLLSTFSHIYAIKARWVEHKRIFDVQKARIDTIFNSSPLYIFCQEPFLVWFLILKRRINRVNFQCSFLLKFASQIIKLPIFVEFMESSYLWLVKIV